MSQPYGDTAEPDRFSVFWRKHLQCFAQYKDANFLTDVCLVCSDGRVYAHQLLLARSSPRIAALLLDAGRLTDEPTLTLHLPDSRAAEVEELVGCLYTGAVPDGRPGCLDWLTSLLDGDPLADNEEVAVGRDAGVVPKEEAGDDDESPVALVDDDEQLTLEPAAAAARKAACCPLCGQGRLRHAGKKKAAGGGNLYSCCACPASQLTSRTWHSHMSGHAGLRLACEVCSRCYGSLRKLKEHRRRQHGGGRLAVYTCTWEGCSYKAKHKQTLNSHVMEKHKGRARRYVPDTTVTCPTCSKTMQNRYFVNFHQKTCSKKDVIYQCDICGKKGFVTSQTLRNHVRAKHSLERPYGCEYCPARYPTTEALSHHRKRHHGVNAKGDALPKVMYPCNLCGKLLTTKVKLESHIEVIHEGKKKWNCSHCTKSFSSKSNLQIHEGTVHTGILPYKCDLCHKMFARRAHLNSHSEADHADYVEQVIVVQDIDNFQMDDIVIAEQVVGVAVCEDSVVDAVKVS